VNPDCDEKCTKAQLDSYHKDRCGMEDDTEIRTDPQAGTRNAGDLSDAQDAALQDNLAQINGVSPAHGA